MASNKGRPGDGSQRSNNARPRLTAYSIGDVLYVKSSALGFRYPYADGVAMCVS